MEALVRVAEAIAGSAFAGQVFVVGGAVRDSLLGRESSGDIDLVTTGDALELARLLYESGASPDPPVVYRQFGTAKVSVAGRGIEIVQARNESYRPASRKPFVRPASLLQDAQRRDFAVNALLQPVEGGAVIDPLGTGLADLDERVLRTPLDPAQTFQEDPLRMLRAVRFRWKLGFEFAPGLEDAVRHCSGRLAIVSVERCWTEIEHMLNGPAPGRAMDDLMRLGLMHELAPELEAMKGCRQGPPHKSDVWGHTVEALDRAGAGLTIRLALLFHDAGKPATRKVDDDGRTRFIGHEAASAIIAKSVLARWRIFGVLIESVCQLVAEHMRLQPVDEPSDKAARRLVRDLGNKLEDLFAVVDADRSSIGDQAGTKSWRDAVARVMAAIPSGKVECPLDGHEIIRATGLPAGPEVGAIKERLEEEVIEGSLEPGDKAAATKLAQVLARKATLGKAAPSDTKEGRE